MAKKRHRPRYDGPPLTDHLAIAQGDTLRLRLDDFNDAGEAAALIDGAPASVTGGIPGELVSAEVVKVFPERVVLRVVEVIEASPDRVQPPCPYVADCSGCQWQHLSPSRQLTEKARRVQKALYAHENLRNARTTPPIASPAQFGYRNHARLTVGKKGEDAGKAGFVNATTRRFVPVDKCLIMHETLNHTMKRIQGRLHGMTQISLRTGINRGSTLIQPAFKPPWPDLDTGQTHFREEVEGVSFRIAASSFFQVNTPQLANTIDLMMKALRLTGREVVVDAYCGVGTFAILLAPAAKRVIGIEESASAIADARQNAKGIHNVHFIQARTENGLENIDRAVDVLILDPPRRGCSSEAIAAVKNLAPTRLAMISCEPVAMARDLALLCDGPYSLDEVYPIDMFPQTRHVEAMAVLSRLPR